MARGQWRLLTGGDGGAEEALSVTGVDGRDADVARGHTGRWDSSGKRACTELERRRWQRRCRAMRKATVEEDGGLDALADSARSDGGWRQCVGLVEVVVVLGVGLLQMEEDGWPPMEVLQMVSARMASASGCASATRRSKQRWRALSREGAVVDAGGVGCRGYGRSLSW